MRMHDVSVTVETRPAVERVYPPKLVMLVVNPLMRRLLRRPGSGPSKGLMLLSVVGRKSGKRLVFPVAKQQIDGKLAVMSNSPWRFNFRGGYECDLWLDGRKRRARGELVTDPAAVTRAYRTALEAVGPGNSRRTGLRINVDRPPTDEELTEAVRRYGLSYVTFTLLD